jgi:hypothetical protein
MGIDDVRSTLTIQFRSRRKCLKFLRQIDSGVLKEYIADSFDNVIWLKFPDQYTRDVMLDTMKRTVPKYKIKINNGQEQILI